MLNKLIILANHLDSEGLINEANSVDLIIRSAGLWDSMMGFVSRKDRPKVQQTISSPKSHEDHILELIRLKKSKIKTLSSSEDITEHYMNQGEIERLKEEIAELELRLSGEKGEGAGIPKDDSNLLLETSPNIDFPDFSPQAILGDRLMPELLAAVYNSDDEKAKAYLTGSGLYNLDSFKSFLKNYLLKRRSDALRLLNEFARANKLYQREATKALFNFSEIPLDFDEVTFDLTTDEKEIEKMVLEYNSDMSEEEARQRVDKFLTTVPDFSEEIEELRDSFTRRRRRYR